MGLTPIERDGDVQWRPVRPWNDAVHALLTHLHDVGFHGAPHSLGVADDGRHQLTWIEGEAGDDSGESDSRLVSAARLIRQYHDAVRGFQAPAGLQSVVGAPLIGPIVCHNDLAPGNTVFAGDEAIALIDWDLAGPGDEIWDLAYATWRWASLYADSFFEARGVAIPNRERRLRMFVDAYGLEQREGFIEVMATRIQSLYDTARVWGGEEGRSGWDDVWRDTKGRQWLGSLRYVEENATRWTSVLTA